MPSLRKWLFSGLLVLVLLIITLGAGVGGHHARPDLAHPAHQLAARPAARGAHPRPGVLFALVVVCFPLARWASNIIGNKLVSWHALLHRIPVVRSIYSGVKQVSDTLFSEKGNAFARPCWCSGRRGHVDHRVPHRLAGR